MTASLCCPKGPYKCSTYTLHALVPSEQGEKGLGRRDNRMSREFENKTRARERMKTQIEERKKKRTEKNTRTHTHRVTERRRERGGGERER